MGRYSELRNYTETPTALAFCSFTIDNYLFAEAGGELPSDQYPAQDSELYRWPAGWQEGNWIWFWCGVFFNNRRTLSS